VTREGQVGRGGERGIGGKRTGRERGDKGRTRLCPWTPLGKAENLAPTVISRIRRL